MNLLLYVALAFLGGAVTPVQAGLNRALGERLGGAAFATVTNFIVGAILSSGVAALLVGAGSLARPNLAATRGLPWWGWLGGACGVTLVFTAAFSVGRLGYAGLIVSIVTGQLVVGLVLDHWGILGQMPRAVTWPRALGVCLVLAGMALVQIEWKK